MRSVLPRHSASTIKEVLTLAFHSAAFLFFFFPAAFLLYLAAPGLRWKNRLLIAVSLVFYTCGQWEGLPCLLCCAALSYAAGALLPRSRRRKGLLAATLALHLLLLGSFKYLGFFAGMAGIRQLPGLPLPVGISFFTFKAMSYVIDVYRDEKSAAGRFSDLLLYLSFFPQAAAGPITRFAPFAAQLERRTLDAAQAARGMRRFIAGFGKKALIAGLAAPVVDSAFSLGGALDVRMAWLGAAAYTIQIYFDFSGYSDMAIGLGTMFGFDTPENFLYPYAARSITDFWRRWHISLSSWFRDYLYIPLGGGRRGLERKCLNKAAVFLLCGLWHGASWTFVLWGAWQGLLSILESILPMDRLHQSAAGRLAGRVFTLLAVCLGFVVFRAPDVATALEYLGAMFSGGLTPASTLALERVSPAAWCALGAGCLGSIPWQPRLRGRAWAEAAAFVGAAGLFALCLLAMAGSGFQPFIYFQF